MPARLEATQRCGRCRAAGATVLTPARETSPTEHFSESGATIPIVFFAASRARQFRRAASTTCRSCARRRRSRRRVRPRDVSRAPARTDFAAVPSRRRFSAVLGRARRARHLARRVAERELAAGAIDEEEARYREMMKTTKEWMAYDPDEVPESHPAPWETHVQNLMENGPWPRWNAISQKSSRAGVRAVQGGASRVQRLRRPSQDV